MYMNLLDLITPLSFSVTSQTDSLRLFFTNFMTSKRRTFARESTFESETIYCPISVWYLDFVACHPCVVAV